MLKHAVAALAIGLFVTPALAANAPVDSTDTAQIAPFPPTVGSPYSGTSPCHKVKAPLTPEQKAQKRAVKEQRAAERAAQGLPPKAPKAHTGHKQRNRSC